MKSIDQLNFELKKLQEKETTEAREAHIEYHKILHRHLDELIADWSSHTECLFMDKTICELMQWSYIQTKNPTEKE